METDRPDLPLKRIVGAVGTSELARWHSGAEPISGEMRRRIIDLWRSPGRFRGWPVLPLSRVAIACLSFRAFGSATRRWPSWSPCSYRARLCAASAFVANSATGC
jgi:hypothetical protein